MTNATNKAPRANSKKGNNKEVIAPATNAPVVETPAVDKVETIVAVTKTSIANGLLTEMFAKPEGERIARKDMIATIMEKANLTKPGASTYLQNFKAKHGYTKPREVATA